MMMGRKIFHTLLGCLMTALMFSDVFAGLSATVDRNNLALDETLILAISRDGSFFSPDLDLSALEKDFLVGSRNQSRSTRIINGSVTSSTTVEVVLTPKHEGALRIPSFSVGNEKTEPITVRVVQEAEPKNNAGDAPLFIETDVDARSAYVQSQIIYTLKIYAEAGVKVQDPGVPHIPDALVEALDPLSYEKIIAGKSYRVFELKYAVFPQKSGSLEIPRVVVQAAVASPQRSRDFFDPFGREERAVTLRSASEKITVMEKPPRYPGSAAWLPVGGLTVVDKWSQGPRDLKVGDATTITMEMTAEGLPGSRLPPIQIKEIDGLKLYQGEAVMENKITGKGIVGVRRESIVLIPTKSGTFHLPAIRIPWWNKKTAGVEYAVINEKELNITGAPENVSQVAMGPAPEVHAQSAAESASAPHADRKEEKNVWLFAAGLLGILWLVTLLLFFRARQQLTALAKEMPRGENEARKVKESGAFTMLRAACRQNDPLAARNAAIVWAQAYWPGEKIFAPADIRQLVRDETLDSLLYEIDAILYGKGEKEARWQGEKLLVKFEKIRNERKKAAQEKGFLPPLYR